MTFHPHTQLQVFASFTFLSSLFVFHYSPTYPAPSIRWLYFSLFTFRSSL
nr:MAG TPA: hypothetical protein [Caudoviricetes sp.]